MRQEIVKILRESTLQFQPRRVICQSTSRQWRNRSFSCSPPAYATALPITATGPPPSAPLPHANQYGERVEKRRRQAELIKQGKEIRASQQPTGSKTNPLRRRFWKEVHVKETPDSYQIFLDARPLRTPSKTILKIPLSKPHLAHGIAIEWDLLENAQQALKNHNIPLTSIASRAQDILEAENTSGTPADTRIRDSIITTLMRYLNTDTILCWAPERSGEEAASLEMAGQRKESLRDIQMRHAKSIISYLNTSVWPGVEIKPVLDGDIILPAKQSEVTRSIIQGWIAGLPAYELAALERAALASKSLLVAARLLIEWSEEFRHAQRTIAEDVEVKEQQEQLHPQRFGVEEAAAACSLEVKWQTDMWGEVEDTHDVNKEDLIRQLGSAVLMISGSR